jgi:hypothetical protein
VQAGDDGGEAALECAPREASSLVNVSVGDCTREQKKERKAHMAEHRRAICDFFVAGRLAMCVAEFDEEMAEGRVRSGRVPPKCRRSRNVKRRKETPHAA